MQTLRSALRVMVATLSVLVFSACTSATNVASSSGAQKSAAGSAPPVGERLRIDVSELGPAFASLGADERREQLADWAVAETLSRLAADEPTALEALAAQPLKRDPRLEALRLFQYGEAREVVLDGRRPLLFLSADDPNKKRQLTRLADAVRARMGRVHDEFQFVLFRADQKRSSVDVTFESRLRGTDLFTPNYDYVSADVRNIEELRRWLETSSVLTRLGCRQAASRMA